MPTESVARNVRQTREVLVVERTKLMLEVNDFRHDFDAARAERNKTHSFRDSLVQRRGAIEKEREEMISYCQQPDSPEALRLRSINEMTATIAALTSEIEFANQRLDKAECRFDDRKSHFESLQQRFETTDRQLKELDAHMMALN